MQTSPPEACGRDARDSPEMFHKITLIAKPGFTSNFSAAHLSMFKKPACLLNAQEHHVLQECPSCAAFDYMTYPEAAQAHMLCHHFERYWLIVVLLDEIENPAYPWVMAIEAVKINAVHEIVQRLHQHLGERLEIPGPYQFLHPSVIPLDQRFKQRAVLDRRARQVAHELDGSRS